MSNTRSQEMPGHPGRRYETAFIGLTDGQECDHCLTVCHTVAVYHYRDAETHNMIIRHFYCLQCAQMKLRHPSQTNAVRCHQRALGLED